MIADLLMFILLIALALFGAWNTAHVRHRHQLTHKRRSTD